MAARRKTRPDRSPGATPDRAADPYAVLGLTPDADLAAVRRARRTLLHRVHPDTAGDLPDAAERTHAINTAYAAIVARIARAADQAERAAHIPPVDVAPAHAWVASPYPMPPQRRGGATFGMILLAATLPAAAIMLPGVPGPAADLFPATEGTSAAAFARAGLHQVRRLLTPAGFVAPAAATPATAPAAPPPVADVAPQDIARAVRQRDRIAGRDGARGVVAYSQQCAARAARRATPGALDFCAAFDTAADRLDEAATRAAYARIGADPARLDMVKALVK